MPSVVVGAEPHPEPDPGDTRRLERAATAQAVLIAVHRRHDRRAPRPRGRPATRFASSPTSSSSRWAAAWPRPASGPAPADPKDAAAELSRLAADSAEAREDDAVSAASPDVARVLASMSAGLSQLATVPGAGRTHDPARRPPGLARTRARGGVAVRPDRRPRRRPRPARQHVLRRPPGRPRPAPRAGRRGRRRAGGPGSHLRRRPRRLSRRTPARRRATSRSASPPPASPLFGAADSDGRRFAMSGLRRAALAALDWGAPVRAFPGLD